MPMPQFHRAWWSRACLQRALRRPYQRESAGLMRKLWQVAAIVPVARSRGTSPDAATAFAVMIKSFPAAPELYVSLPP
jgi:hypothetical protein